MTKHLDEGKILDLSIIPMNQRTHLEARLMWCEESIQRKLAMDLMQMLRSGILERLDNIVNSRNPAPFVVSFYTANKTEDDVAFFPNFSKSHVGHFGKFTVSTLNPNLI